MEENNGKDNRKMTRKKKGQDKKPLLAELWNYMLQYKHDNSKQRQNPYSIRVNVVTRNGTAA